MLMRMPAPWLYLVQKVALSEGRNSRGKWKSCLDSSD